MAVPLGNGDARGSIRSAHFSIPERGAVREDNDMSRQTYA
jgi:hypothetical protein